MSRADSIRQTASIARWVSEAVTRVDQNRIRSSRARSRGIARLRTPGRLDNRRHARASLRGRLVRGDRTHGPARRHTRGRHRRRRRGARGSDEDAGRRTATWALTATRSQSSRKAACWYSTPTARRRAPRPCSPRFAGSHRSPYATSSTRIGTGTTGMAPRSITDAFPDVRVVAQEKTRALMVGPGDRVQSSRPRRSISRTTSRAFEQAVGRRRKRRRRRLRIWPRSRRVSMTTVFSRAEACRAARVAERSRIRTAELHLGEPPHRGPARGTRRHARRQLSVSA